MCNAYTGLEETNFYFDISPAEIRDALDMYVQAASLNNKFRGGTTEKIILIVPDIIYQMRNLLAFIVTS